MTAADADRQRSQRLLVMAAAVTVALVAVLAVLIVVLLRDPATQAAAPRQPTPSASKAATFEPDISWASVSGVDLPVSRIHGPRTLTKVTAAGFSDSEIGAAIAAVHIVSRSSAAAGPAVFEPTITQQVTGVNAAAMKLLAAQQYEQLRAAQGVAAGEPITGDADVLGYRIDAYAPREFTARVQVFLGSPDLSARGQLLRLDIQLQRAAGDWRVVAPPRGDWGTVTTTLSRPPDGLISYGGQR